MVIEKEKKTKILVNVYEPLISIMKHKIDRACLKRDAYLDQALRSEVSLLREEVTIPNSDMAKNFIVQNIKQIPLKPLNLLLSTSTVELINNVCSEKNIPRDAFINRFFLLLVSSDRIIEVLFFTLFKKHIDIPSADIGFFRDDWHEWSQNNINLESNQGMIDSFNKPNILDSIEQYVRTNPFWRLRDYFSCYEKGWKLYNYSFEKDSLSKLPKEYGPLKIQNTLGFNTYISDSAVSNHEIYNEEISETDKLLVFLQQENNEKQEEEINQRGDSK